MAAIVRHLCCWGLDLFVPPAIPPQAGLNIVTKDKNLFCCSIVKVKLGQKLSSEPNDERTYSIDPIEQMRLLAAHGFVNLKFNHQQ